MSTQIGKCIQKIGIDAKNGEREREREREKEKKEKKEKMEKYDWILIVKIWNNKYFTYIC